MTNANEAREIGLAFLNAWAQNDMDSARTYLHHDITFESPMVSLSGLEAVAEAMGQFAQAVASIDVLAAAADGEHVVVMYDMHTGPFGTIRAAEHYTIKEGKIVSDQLVFDSAAMRQDK